MPIIRCKQNYGYYVADPGGQLIGVRTRCGEYRYVKFLGFISATHAKRLQATPVKLSACAYSMGVGSPWIELANDEYIQGALIGSTAVYAVLAANNRPRVISTVYQ